ncbi:hypothetical protein TVNIR_0427 [Thioalkalivibrio nitratireducens DSM 14787]|uniref:Uncharacterized protein n=1 Tax=Thioalkalivibrio nitratireducens (strain DSM 14787 / UNIQEM 213 / ALEN2) TaxID=1255043 RepID=L0DT11_THIND|nr:hypothetical protein TVNIR_0427 [Thioalkalivibrio nitratireducens DSM 14787]
MPARCAAACPNRDRSGRSAGRRTRLRRSRAHRSLPEVFIERIDGIPDTVLATRIGS